MSCDDPVWRTYLTTREAADYCGFKTTGALRKAKLDGRLVPVGRRGGRGTLMWSRESLDRYLHGEVPASLAGGRARTPPEANGGRNEERTVGSEVEQLGGPKPELPGVYRRKEGGFLVRGRVIDPKTGSMRQVVRNLPDLTEPEQARLRLKAELDSIRKGASRPTNKQPERFATYAASLLREKVEKRQICSSTTEEKWMFALRHIFGLKDDKGTIDVGIRGLGDIFVDQLTRADIEAWRDSWEPRVNAGTYAPTTVNEWIAVLRVITKKMKVDYDLPVDPCADVEDISTKGHRTYTFEQPNSLGVDELSTFFEVTWEKYPQHFAVMLLGSVTGLRPSSLYALRRCGDNADVKWDQGLLLDPTFARHQGAGDGDDQDQPRSGHQAPGLRDVRPSLARRQAAHHAGHGAKRAPLPIRSGHVPSNSRSPSRSRRSPRRWGSKSRSRRRPCDAPFRTRCARRKSPTSSSGASRATSPNRCSSAIPRLAVTSRVGHRPHHRPHPVEQRLRGANAPRGGQQSGQHRWTAQGNRLTGSHEPS